MKKTFLVLAVSAGLLMGAEYTKEDRIRDMNEMANAMNAIQSGFFYNNFDTVANGVNALSDAIVRVRPPLEDEVEKDPMARYVNKKIQMTNKIVKKINRKALVILQRFKEGDSAQATQAYTKIMAQCMKCHREIRHW